MDFEQAAMWATSKGVSAAGDAYEFGRDVHAGATGVVHGARSAVGAGLDIATNTAHQGYDTVERGIAGAIPGVVDGVSHARDMAERPINWATDRAASAAANAWSWMTD